MPPEPDSLDARPGRLIDDARLLIGSAWRLDRRRVLLQLTLLLVNGLVGGASLLLLVPIVNSVADPGASVAVPLVGEVGLSSLPLWLLLVAFVILAAAQALISRTATVNAARVQQQLVDSLRQDAFAAILAARWSFVLGLRRSDIIQVVTTGAARAGLAFQQMMNGSVALVLAIATAVVALLVSPGVAALAIVAVIVAALVQATSVRPAYRLGRLFSERSRHLQGVVTDSLDSLRLVRAHDASAVWADRLSTAFTDAREVQLANTQRMTTVTAVSSVGMAVAASVLVLVSVWASVPPTSIVVILVLVARLNSQVQRVVTMAAQLANSLPAVRDLAGLTADGQSAREIPAGATSSRSDIGADPTTPMLEFRSVTFHYPGAGHGVTDLSLTVPRGDITVLTGHSGAGKSTSADLALGLLTPQAGEVLVDGRRSRRRTCSGGVATSRTCPSTRCSCRAHCATT